MRVPLSPNQKRIHKIAGDLLIAWGGAERVRFWDKTRFADIEKLEERTLYLSRRYCETVCVDEGRAMILHLLEVELIPDRAKVMFAGPGQLRGDCARCGAKYRRHFPGGPVACSVCDKAIDFKSEKDVAI